MKRTSQFGRTMLETISILALIGVLGVTGIYMYKKGMDSVRADSVVKDVLIRAEQKNANDNLNDMGTKKNVFVPEYKKGTGDASEYRTKGSYGYSYEITYSATDAVVVKTNDTIITPGACNAIKSKLMTYDTKKSPRVVCAVQNPIQGNDIVRNCVNDATDIISNGCPDENIDNLYFVVAFGQSVERRAPLPRAEISPNREEGNCPVGTSKDGTGESIGENGCRCLHPSAHWTGSHCVICDENEVWNSRLKICEHGCPTDVPVWDGMKCVQCVSSEQCPGKCSVCMEGKCSDSQEVVVPQYGVFADSTACYAIKEIAHLGPYACPYDIYVKGHIDDTFLVRDINGKDVCTNDKGHRMVDGILYTIPAGQEVKVYAKDTGCAVIAWERDYHGAEARTPQKPMMKIIRSEKTPGYCNRNI